VPQLSEQNIQRTDSWVKTAYIKWSIFLALSFAK